jgi:hypothetical protein
MLRCDGDVSRCHAASTKCGRFSYNNLLQSLKIERIFDMIGKLSLSYPDPLAYPPRSALRAHQ